MALETADEFLARTAGGGKGRAVPEDADAFLRRTAPTAGAATTPMAAPSAWQYVPPESGDPDMTPRPSEFPMSVAEWRNALQPTPGYARLPGLAGILPFAFKETAPGSGKIDTSHPSLSDLRTDWGSTATALGGNALLDLLEGTGQATSVGGPNAPLAGKMTPEGTMLLLGGMSSLGRDIRFGPRVPTPPSPGDLRVAPLSADFVANPLTPEARATIAAPSGAPNALNPPGTPATPTGIPVTREPPPPPSPIPTGLTPEQITEFRAIPETLPPLKKEIATPEDAAERADQIVRHFAGIGNKEPIPDTTGGLHTITQNAGLSTLYRAVRDTDPQPFILAEEGLKKDAMSTLRGISGTADDLAAAKLDRANTTGPMYQKAWANKGVADPSGAIQVGQDILKSPAGQNDTISAEIPRILKKLEGQTDPEQLKGITDSIDETIQSLKVQGKGDRRTLGALDKLDKAITAEIDRSTPGFAAAEKKYSEMSRRIDEMSYLQGRKLTDLQGNPTLGNMRATLDDIARKQAGDKFHPADSVTAENLATLQKVHDQLQREAYAQGAGKSIGSNTFQNLATNTTIGNIAGHAGNALLSTALGATADLAFGGVGAVGALAGAGASGILKGISANQAAKLAAAREAGRQLLLRELRDRLLNIDNKGLTALRGSSPP